MGPEYPGMVWLTGAETALDWARLCAAPVIPTGTPEITGLDVESPKEVEKPVPICGREEIEEIEVVVVVAVEDCEEGIDAAEGMGCCRRENCWVRRA